MNKSLVVVILFVLFLSQILAQINNDFGVIKSDEEREKPRLWSQLSKKKTLLILILAIISITIFLLIICCCIFYFYYRGHKSEELALTPSELVEIGATPSDLQAANITPSRLKGAGASYGQMAQLGATPSQLVEVGANRDVLQNLGATQSQLSRVGFHAKKPEKDEYQTDSNYRQLPRRGRSPLPTASEYSPPSPRRRPPTLSGYSEVEPSPPKSQPKKRQNPTRPKNEASNVSNISQKSSHHSKLVESIAQKLKPKGKQKHSLFQKSEVRLKNEKKSTSPPLPLPSPPDDNFSVTRPLSPSAMKPVTDDSMSVAMAAEGSAVTTAPNN